MITQSERMSVCLKIAVEALNDVKAMSSCTCTSDEDSSGDCSRCIAKEALEGIAEIQK